MLTDEELRIEAMRLAIDAAHKGLTSSLLETADEIHAFLSDHGAFTPGPDGARIFERKVALDEPNPASMRFLGLAALKQEGGATYEYMDDGANHVADSIKRTRDWYAPVDSGAKSEIPQE